MTIYCSWFCLTKIDGGAPDFGLTENVSNQDVVELVLPARKNINILKSYFTKNYWCYNGYNKWQQVDIIN